MRTQRHARRVSWPCGEFLQETLKSLKAGGGIDLAESQSNWLKSREELCPLFDNIDPGMYLGGSDCKHFAVTVTGIRFKEAKTAIAFLRSRSLPALSKCAS